MAYRASYEGHPITDDVIIDAQQLLDDIAQLEVDAVAEDFLSIKLNPSKRRNEDDIVAALSMDVDRTAIHNGDAWRQDIHSNCDSARVKSKY